MKTKVLAASALLVAVISAAGGWLLTRQAPTNYAAPTDHSVVEMMPESSPEWAEIHKYTKDGVKVQSEVMYRNGERGTRYWRENGTLAKEVVLFTDGTHRKKAEFAADGEQIVSGHEVRNDRSIVWEASVDANQVVTKKTFWKNGDVFQIETRKVGSPKVDQWFYYPGGIKWMHYIGTRDPSDIADLQEIWSDNGVLSFTHYKGLNDSSVDSTYRPDGKLEHRQTWVMRSIGYMYSSTPSRVRVLLKVEQFATDGVTLEREYMMNSSGYYVDRVIDHAKDGSYTESELLYDGTVTVQTKYDAAGKQLESKHFSARDNMRIEMPSEYADGLSEEFDPGQTWRDEEAGVNP